MTNHSNRGRPPRPLQHLNAIGSTYNNAWDQIDLFRRDRGVDLPNWPDWCFMPIAAWYSIVSAKVSVNVLPLHYIHDVSKLAALGTWRYTQSIYRIDSELYSAISKTVLTGDLPCDVLYRMPEWCVYIETPGDKWLNYELFGFWAHLEWDANTKRHELRLLLDCDEALIPLVLHLGKWTITESVDRFISESKKQGRIAGFDLPINSAHVQKLAETTYPIISLLLYICSNGVEYSDQSTPGNPSPKKTKKGWKLFPAQKPRIWNLGKKTGDKIRQAKKEVHERKGPAPHIRRAHWHSFWKGPLDGNRELFVKFIPPIPVATGDQNDR